MSFIEKELGYLLQSIKKSRFRKLTKDKVIFELLANGVAAIIAYFIYAILTSIFSVQSKGKLWWKKNVTHKDTFWDIDKATFEWIEDWIATPIIFIICLLVFSFVEQIMENYLELRKKERETE